MVQPYKTSLPKIEHEKDSDDFSPSPYRPPPRQSTRKAKRAQHKPRAARQKSTDSENNEPIRRRQQQR